jgi:hypothetical protein
MLVAGGRTNREISHRLVISQRTAGRHVKHALTKLGLRSRSQLAVWVVQQEVMQTPSRRGCTMGAPRGCICPLGLWLQQASRCGPSAADPDVSPK